MYVPTHYAFSFLVSGQAASSVDFKNKQPTKGKQMPHATILTGDVSIQSPTHTSPDKKQTQHEESQRSKQNTRKKLQNVNFWTMPITHMHPEMTNPPPLVRFASLCQILNNRFKATNVQHPRVSQVERMPPFTNALRENKRTPHTTVLFWNTCIHGLDVTAHA